MKQELLRKETENFDLNFQDELKGFILTSLDIFESKKKMIINLFGSELTEKIKASFFTDRPAFVDYIKSISNGNTPPSWATGCFYNGEIQTLVNLNSEEDFSSKEHTLTHETVHLYFEKLIYQKYKLDRVRWLDESFAGFLDGHNDNITVTELSTLFEELSPLKDFDVNILDDIEKVRTTSYNGYDMFTLIGIYIFENHLEEQHLSLLKTSPKDIRKLGREIMSSALDYLKQKISPMQ